MNMYMTIFHDKISITQPDIEIPVLKERSADLRSLFCDGNRILEGRGSKRAPSPHIVELW